jgi:chromatin structure-remodeling complex protein RSC7
MKWFMFGIDRADTQPTTSRWEVLPDSRVLGGTKSGNGAWALAWVDTVLELPSTEEMGQREAQDRDVLMRAVDGLS